MCTFQVANIESGPIILGLPTCTALNIITLNMAIETKPMGAQPKKDGRKTILKGNNTETENHADKKTVRFEEEKGKRYSPGIPQEMHIQQRPPIGDICICNQ